MKVLLKILTFGAIAGLIVYLAVIGISIMKDPIPSEDKAIKRNLSPHFNKISSLTDVSYPIRSGDRLFGGVEVISARGHKYEFEIPEISAFETATTLSLLEFDDYFYKCRYSMDQEMIEGMDFIKLRESLELPSQITGINSLFQNEAEFVDWLSRIPTYSTSIDGEKEVCFKYPKL